MLKILVVDDVENIRTGIQAMLYQMSAVTGNQLEKADIFTASNGEEAMQLLSNCEMDLVITDIRMPGMDGIALIGMCHHICPSAAVVIISGYDDFSYAQRALELGVRAYLLKPIDRNELYRIVDKIYQEKTQIPRLDSEQMNYSQNAGLLHYIRSSQYDLKRSQLILRKAPFLQNGYCLYVCGIPGQEGSRASDAGVKRFVAACEALKEAIFYMVDDSEFIVLAGNAHEVDDCFSRRFQGENIVAAKSDHYIGVEYLQDAYRQAKTIYVHRLLHPGKCLLTRADIENVSLDFNIPHTQIRALWDIIGVCKEKQLEDYLAGIFDRATLCRYGIGYTFAVCDTLYRAMRSIVRETDGLEEMDLHLVNEPLQFRQMHDYLLYVRDKLFQLHHAVSENHQNNRNRYAMETALRYIHRNFAKPINLAMTSNEVSLNYSYFSTQFRKYTGKTFSEYLRDTRIAEAKKLLQNPEARIMQIAQAVGYDTYKSFFRAFKESVGISPQEYQQKFMR